VEAEPSLSTTLFPDSEKKFVLTHESACVLCRLAVPGVVFSLTFSPTEYGKYEHARLYIVTEDNQWSYDIRGVYPGFEVARNIKPKVDSHLSKAVADKLTVRTQ
jgi:hypothetical protein